ncbi:metal-dependent transcriptional regulator [Dehalobacterium formicoaceticum]|uniref:Metal-dependent transcriptional regulator n=1 Tax=Dehalobacterium formicoaceticum TaxID=51515 RepID=A0ABT1Y832_9FIRM|nr:metal-dependent transcriptional regulator [Dehalobacterium formicoaceticum]MCR6547050.1 metal-dependent transcriptional regulator [Dehalobacterium formicoaceticum]
MKVNKIEIRISNSLEDYLEAILIISEENNLVRITDLARFMKISKPSASEAVKSLVDIGFLRHEKYGPVELTEEGRMRAAEVRKRHRLLKKFLTEVLEVPPAIADQDACLMEHAISADTISQLLKFLESQVALNESE